ESRVSKLASLVVKLGALLFVLLVDPQFSIDLQLIGGVLVLQTLPAVALGLFTRWFHRAGLIAGWIAGMSSGLWMLYSIPNPATHHSHFGGSGFSLGDTTIYAGFLAVIVNLVVTVVATLIARAAGVRDGIDATEASDYVTDEATA